METEMLAPETAVKAMAVLCLIPLVLFELWSEYFVRGVAESQKQTREFHLAREQTRLRSAAILGVLFQVAVYFSASDLRKLQPGWVNAIGIAAVCLQMILQARTERKLFALAPAAQKPTAESARNAATLALRSFGWVLISGAAYIGGIAGATLLFVVAAKACTASPAIINLAALAGLFCGIWGGIALNFALGPVHLRRLMPAQIEKDAEILGMTEKGFAAAELPAPAVYRVDAPIATAIMAGFARGRGWFRPGLFLTRKTIEGLTPDELRAVVLHEVAHLKLGHLVQRMKLTLSLIGITTLGGSLLVLALEMLTHSASALFAPLLAAVAFYWAFRLLGKQSRMHEHEADVYSVERLGSESEALCRALRKLALLTGESNANNSTMAAWRSHPSTDRRVQVIQHYFRNKSAAKRAENSGSDQDRAA